jgi:hypothetical protein
MSDRYLRVFLKPFGAQWYDFEMGPATLGQIANTIRMEKCIYNEVAYVPTDSIFSMTVIILGATSRPNLVPFPGGQPSGPAA